MMLLLAVASVQSYGTGRMMLQQSLRVVEMRHYCMAVGVPLYKECSSNVAVLQYPCSSTTLEALL
eukprot:385537-Pyramimonas_sp.AAC.1